MSAQPGGAILLGYGPQPGAAQSGAAVLLEYAATGPVRTTLRAGIVARWGRALPSRTPLEVQIGETRSADTRTEATWGKASLSASRASVPWGVATPTDRAARAPWGAFALHANRKAVSAWGVASAADRAAVVPWAAFPRNAVVTGRSEWGLSTPADTAAIVPWGALRPLAHPLIAVIRRAHHITPHWVLPWNKYSRTLRPGWGIVIPDGEPPRDENGTILVLIRRAYYVLNTFTLATVDGEPVVPTASFSARLDADSWAWTWSTVVHAAHLDLLRPGGLNEAVELIATINGQSLRLRVEQISRERRFGRADLRISGRSRSALLAAPAAPVVTRANTTARTAQQLAEDVLTDNGVPIGWTLDWRITDWLVPAGIWNHTGTYMDAITRIAEAAGAYVQPHDTDATLLILPRYPLAPWDWATATPDIQLPEDVATVEGIEWADRPAYDAVYLAGTGILGHVVRTGTSGGTVAPMITDELLSHTDATLQRGRAVLSDTGRQARITLNLPVLEETEIIKPGTLLDYVEQGVTHRGLVRGVSVAVDFPRITQSVEIETHEPV